MTMMFRLPVSTIGSVRVRDRDRAVRDWWALGIGLGVR